MHRNRPGPTPRKNRAPPPAKGNGACLPRDFPGMDRDLLLRSQVLGNEAPLIFNYCSYYSSSCRNYIIHNINTNIIAVKISDNISITGNNCNCLRPPLLRA